MSEEIKKDLCPLLGEDCSQEDHSICQSEVNKYARVVFCKQSNCIWNKMLQEGRFIKHHKDWKPLGPNDKYKGICVRPEVGVSPKVIKTMEGTTQSMKYDLVQCDFYSTAFIKGHIDFAKLLQSNGQVYGGEIPDPIEGDTVYH